jgi:feruloyl esterase
MRHFFDRGGKLILWHGWADAAIPPQATLDLHQAILRQSGPRAKDAMRLFMVPGLQHCFGGTGPTDFGQMGVPSPNDPPERGLSAALLAWVEKGRTPERVIGRKGGMPDMMGAPPAGSDNASSTTAQRLICAYPAMAVLKRGADPEQASSYTCQ